MRCPVCETAIAIDEDWFESRICSCPYCQTGLQLRDRKVMKESRMEQEFYFIIDEDDHGVGIRL